MLCGNPPSLDPPISCGLDQRSKVCLGETKFSCFSQRGCLGVEYWSQHFHVTDSTGPPRSLYFRLLTAIYLTSNLPPSETNSYGIFAGGKSIEDTRKMEHSGSASRNSCAASEQVNCPEEQIRERQRCFLRFYDSVPHDSITE